MTIEDIIVRALAEDSALGDVTSEASVPENTRGLAELLWKDVGIVAGLEAVEMTVHLCDPTARVHALCGDGQHAVPMTRLATIEGTVRGLLRAERVALNIVQRMSGVATFTRAFVDAVAGTHAHITDTRKTAPGLRLIDKLAVRIGGGVNHRFGLDDMVLIKDNHVVAAGSITNAVAQCRTFLERRHLRLALEVETKNLEEVQEALRCRGVNRIMLDNFPLPAMHEAVRVIDHAVEVEASGGITLVTVRAIAETGVDFISVGALTHSVRAIDISMELLQV